MESQAQKIRKVMDDVGAVSDDLRRLESVTEIK